MNRTCVFPYITLLHNDLLPYSCSWFTAFAGSVSRSFCRSSPYIKSDWTSPSNYLRMGEKLTFAMTRNVVSTSSPQHQQHQHQSQRQQQQLHHTAGCLAFPSRRRANLSPLTARGRLFKTRRSINFFQNDD